VKRVLLIAYFFPPEPAAGALRPWYLAKYLPEHGWEATVLTRRFNGVNETPFTVIRAPELRRPSFVKSAADAPLVTGRPPSQFREIIKSIVYFPDSTVGWFPAAALKALSLEREHHFDAILSSAMPPTTHMVASLVARTSKVPWVADFRDPWIGPRYLKRGPIRSRIESVFERNVMKPAAALTAISISIASAIQTRHPSKEVHVIENSFDPDEWEDVPNAFPQEFRITYTGSLYDGQRSPDLIFAAAAKLKELDPFNSDMVFDFYGPDSSVVMHFAEAHGISAAVHYHGTISRHDALRVQRSSAALLILLSMDSQTADELGSKILEYAGARRPIIAVGPADSVVREIVESNKLGWYASTEEECLRALKAAHERFRQRDIILPATELQGIRTARTLAADFAAVLNWVT